MSRYLPLVYQASQIPMLASNIFPPSQQIVVWLCYRFVQLQVVSCWDMDIMGYHNISYLINASIYLVKGGRLALCLVFCSTLAALVSIIPVLCSLSLRSLRGWVIYGTPLTVRFE